MKSSQNPWLIVFLVAVMVVVAGLWWMNRGYGEVSAQTYEYSKALYSACQTKNELHLDKVEKLLAIDDTDGLSSKERVWLETIISKARSGNWETAAKNARRMMEDQVEY